MKASEQAYLALTENKITLATAESCTGGLIGKLMTDIPGSSAVYAGGCITYTNQVKIKLLGVMPETIAEFTEVSTETAVEMAKGVRLAVGADIGVSTTGYAGPGGGTEKDPVGTVYIAASDGVNTVTERLSLSPDSTRCEVREAAAKRALECVIKLIDSRKMLTK